MAEYIEITGGTPLHGVVQAAGAKNAVLPLLIASLLSAERIEYSNVPNLEDVGLTLQLLEYFGAEVEYRRGSASVRVPKLVASDASYSLVRALRASFWVLAPLLARGRAARVALPGGDIIGARPVDIHLSGLERMGADIKVKHGVVYATAVHGLRPVRFEMRFPSVGATHQLIMAASLTPGTTVLEGAAREPEIVALAALLNSMGADVEGAGSSTIVIRGKEELGGASVRIIGDRIEAGTYLLAGLATGGSIRVNGIAPEYFGEFLSVLDQMGAEVSKGDDFVEVKRNGVIKPLNVRTGPFPLLATDLQPQIMATLCLAQGVSTVEESVYEGRYGHVSELCRMGAQIRIEDRVATVTGVEKLTSAPVEGLDIRAAAGLVIAGLSAHGISQIHEPQHLRRGYECLEEKFRSVGAHIGAKMSDPEDYMFTGC